MPFRYSLLMQVTTIPISAADAINHTGAWSEGYWNGTELALDGPELDGIANARASMLPKQAAVIGIRRQKYTIDGNKVIGEGSSTFKVRKPGTPSYNVNIPQDAMLFAAATSGTSSGSKFKTKCLPDEVVEQGEFNGNAGYKTRMTIYGQKLVQAGMGSLVKGAGGVVARVLDITAGVATLSSTFVAGIGQYIRFRRVYDHNTNLPITGSFRVSSQTALLYTLEGLPTGTVVKNSGHAVLDSIGTAGWGSITFQRVCEGKIGSPFERYRGRQSKRRR